MKHEKPDERELAAREPRYRTPPYEDLSSLVAGRIQAGPQSTPPRAGALLFCHSSGEWNRSGSCQ